MHEPIAPFQELTEQYKARVIGGIPSLSPIAYYPALHGRGATLYDRSQYANHGAITGATWKRLPSGIWVLNCDGSGDYVTIPHSTYLNLGTKVTFLFWLNLTSVKAAGAPAYATSVLLAKGSGVTTGYTVTYQHPDYIVINAYGKANADAYIETSGISLATWYCVGISDNAGTVTFVINGESQGTDTKTSGYETNTDNLRVGSWEYRTASDLNGLILPVVIILDALSVAQMAQFYHRTKWGHR